MGSDQLPQLTDPSPHRLLLRLPLQSRQNDVRDAPLGTPRRPRRLRRTGLYALPSGLELDLDDLAAFEVPIQIALTGYAEAHGVATTHFRFADVPTEKSEAWQAGGSGEEQAGLEAGLEAHFASRWILRTAF